MGQFIAILKDSFREAKSGWMLQIMLVLSVLLMVLIASIGFRPTTLQDELGFKLDIINQVLGDNKRYSEAGSPKFAIENLTVSKPEEPWKSDYTFDYVVRCPSGEDMRKANRPELPVARSVVEGFLRSELSYVNHLDVTGGPPELDKPFEPEEQKKKEKETLPQEVRYKVTTKGTSVEDRLAWRHKLTVLFVYELPVYTSLRLGVYRIEKWLVNNIGIWILMLVGVIITAGFIPSMLTPGSLALMVSKPIGRVQLLVAKYFGGLIFVLLLTTITVLGVWAAIGLRTDIWTTNFFAIIPIMTFYFAVLYAFSTLTAVFTRSALVSILMTLLAWGFMWGIGKINSGVENEKVQLTKAKEKGSPEAVQLQIQSEQPLWGFIPRPICTVATSLHYVTPRTFQLDDRLGRLIAEGVLTKNEIKVDTDYADPPTASWAELILVTVAGIIVLLAIACWRFSNRDY